MSRTNAGKLVLNAKSAGTAVGAFNVILLEHAEALVAGAEIAKLPVILQISENCVSYHKALKPISVSTIAIAESSTVPVSVHLDHAESEDLVKEALDLGYDSVMFDGSKLSYEDNVHAPGVRTNPLEAKAFAEATGADLVAVAVGSSHAMTTRDATLDFELIAEIARTVSVPLVLHGSSGVSDPDLQKAVKAGMSKINIATHLNNVFTHEIREALGANPKLVDPRKYIAPGRTAVATEVARLLTLLG
jgi:fructose-bisphosphate aldolase class II